MEGTKGPTTLYTLLYLNLLLSFSQISLNLSGYKPPIQIAHLHRLIQIVGCDISHHLPLIFSFYGTFSVCSAHQRLNVVIPD